MANDLLAAAALLWVAALLASLLPRIPPGAARGLLAAGCAALLVPSLGWCRAGSAAAALPWQLAGARLQFQLDSAGAWLLFFGLWPALFACFRGSPRAPGPRGRVWSAGVALSLLGALGVFGLQDATSFLVAWELMSLGGACQLLGEARRPAQWKAVQFMLALLEVGAIALVLGLLARAAVSGSPAFASFAAGGARPGLQFVAALLFLAGFGAKLGLLPFYEWFPGAYASGSGASGAILSGVVLNAGFYALARALLHWARLSPPWELALCTVVVVVAIASAILTALYAFQQDDWRRLLCFSTAENASVAVAALGAALLFQRAGHAELAGLAILVPLIHLAAHSLAKGALFLAADDVYRRQGNYGLVQRGWLRLAAWPLGAGALCAAMSLAALPPLAGFASEWYLFQTLFQSFRLPNLYPRLLLALAGAALALTAAIALATFVKLFGVGLLGHPAEEGTPVPGRGEPRPGWSVFALGIGVLGLGAGLPWWLGALRGVSLEWLGLDAASGMRSGWMLVPLHADFAFISPPMLLIAAPLLALLPLGLARAFRYGPPRRVPVWYGGLSEAQRPVQTTSLTFSNALRTFYGFVYRPTREVNREYNVHPYFVRRLVFTQNLAPIFGPLLFVPATRLARGLAYRLRGMQSGSLNRYTGLIGLLLLLVLMVAILR